MQERTEILSKSWKQSKLRSLATGWFIKHDEHKLDYNLCIFVELQMTRKHVLWTRANTRK